MSPVLRLVCVVLIIGVDGQKQLLLMHQNIFNLLAGFVTVVVDGMLHDLVITDGAVLGGCKLLAAGRAADIASHLLRRHQVAAYYFVSINHNYDITTWPVATPP